MPRLIIALLIAAAAPLAAAQPEDLAADIVAARAAEARLAGRAAMADALDALARALDKQQVTLDQAVRIVELVGDASAVAVATTMPAAAASPPRPAIAPERVASVLDGDLAAAPPAAAAQAPAAQPAPAVATDVVTTVLAVQKNEVGKPAMLVLDGGADRDVVEGTEFIIRREGYPLVRAVVVQVKDKMSICEIIPGTWSEDQATVKEGDEAAMLAR
ncbi:MAG TPA: hypothetical protein VEL07_15265 [Planctomycetota bacterium]|nr:hypothetical protein [Planctomycetota bacterium]